MSQTSTNSNRGSAPSTPRWVKVFASIGVVLILVFVILHLTGNSFGFSDHLAMVQHWWQQLWR